MLAYDSIMPAGPAPTIHTSQLSDDGCVSTFLLVAISARIQLLLENHLGRHIRSTLVEHGKWRAGKGSSDSSQSNVVTDGRVLSPDAQLIESS